MEKEYYELLKINKYLLDTELVNQPQLFCEWAEMSANASADKDDAKAEYELIKAIKANKIRGDSKIKLTNPEIEAKITQNKKVKKAHKKYLDCSRKDKVLAEAKSAFKQRQKSLEGLVQINMQMHFAEPNLNRNKNLKDESDLINNYHNLNKEKKERSNLKEKKRITKNLKRSKTMKKRSKL